MVLSYLLKGMVITMTNDETTWLQGAELARCELESIAEALADDIVNNVGWDGKMLDKVQYSLMGYDRCDYAFDAYWEEFQDTKVEEGFCDAFYASSIKLWNVLSSFNALYVNEDEALAIALGVVFHRLDSSDVYDKCMEVVDASIDQIIEDHK